MIKNDRRISQRFQGKPSNYIQYTEGSGRIRDLSLEGVFVLDPEPLPAGTKIEFSLHLDTQDVPLTGVVRRSMPGEGMAILFTDLSSEAKRRIKIQIAGLVAAPEGMPKR
jgi:hypothetical protein